MQSIEFSACRGSAVSVRPANEISSAVGAGPAKEVSRPVKRVFTGVSGNTSWVFRRAEKAKDLSAEEKCRS